MAIALKYAANGAGAVKDSASAVTMPQLTSGQSASPGDTIIVVAAYDNTDWSAPAPSMSITGTSPPSVTWTNLILSDSHTSSTAGGARSAIVLGAITSGTLTPSHTIGFDTLPQVTAKAAGYLILTGVDESDPLRTTATTIQGTGGSTITSPATSVIGDYIITAYAAEQNSATSMAFGSYTTGQASASNMALGADHLAVASTNQRLTSNPGGTADYSASSIVLKASSGGTAKTPEDTPKPKISETVTVTATAAILETLRPKISEAVAIAVSRAAADTLLPKVVETTSLVTSTAKAASDTLLPKIAESVLVAISTSKAGSDSIKPKVAESISVTATVTTSDSIKPRVVETTSTTAQVNISDTLRPKISESTSVLLTTVVGISDSAKVKIQESISVSATITASDTLRPKTYESMSGIPGSTAISFYNGSWTAAVSVKYYNGSSWTEISTIKTWNGSEWI